MKNNIDNQVEVLVMFQYSKIENTYRTAATSLNKKGKKISYNAKNGFTFDELKNIFPYAIKLVNSEKEPLWGSGWYIKDEEGYPKLYKENWDSSR